LYRRGGGRRGGGGRGRKRDPDSPYPLEDFSGKIKIGDWPKEKSRGKRKKSLQRVGLMFGRNVLF